MCLFKKNTFTTMKNNSIILITFPSFPGLFQYLAALCRFPRDKNETKLESLYKIK